MGGWRGGAFSLLRGTLASLEAFAVSGPTSCLQDAGAGALVQLAQRALPLLGLHGAWPQPMGACPRAMPVQDVYESAEQMQAAGAKIIREPGPVPGIGTKVGKG